MPTDLQCDDLRRRAGNQLDSSCAPPHPGSGSIPGSSQALPPSSQTTDDAGDDTGEDPVVTTDYVTKLIWEGGVEFLAFLLSKVVPLAKDQPVTYRDIAKLPADLREQWRLACQEELEALRKCKVYELADLPPGHTAVKNCWVFMTKSDGYKKARLIAKGFSQIEGIDFDQIFSPVVRYESICLLLAIAALK